MATALAGPAVEVPQSQLDLRPSGIGVALVGYLGPPGFIPEKVGVPVKVGNEGPSMIKT